jgi:hypothetical protein
LAVLSLTDDPGVAQVPLGATHVTTALDAPDVPNPIYGIDIIRVLPQPFALGRLVPEGTKQWGVQARDPATGLFASNVSSTSTKSSYVATAFEAPDGVQIRVHGREIERILPLPFALGKLVSEGTPQWGVRARDAPTGVFANHVHSTSTGASILPPAHLDEIDKANYDPDMSSDCSDCDSCIDTDMDDDGEEEEMEEDNTQKDDETEKEECK